MTAILLAAGCGRSTVENGPTPSSSIAANTSITLSDLDGKPVVPFASDHPDVVVFLRTDCPVSNVYAPEIRRLRDTFAKQGIDFWMVYPDPDEATADIRRQLADYHLDGPALRDPKTALARLARARVTPEAAVFDSRHALVYHGRIDDRFAALGVRRAEPTTHELSDVLGSLVAGVPVTNAPAKGVGCSITFIP